MTSINELKSILTQRGDHKYEGITYSSRVREEDLERIQNRFQFREDDIFIATFPKSGTTWAQEILYLVTVGGDLDKAKAEYLDDRVTYLEFSISFGKTAIGIKANDKNVLDELSQRAPPRLMKTHLGPKLLQRALKAKSKFIVVFRNPKDVFISFLNFYRLFNPEFDGNVDIFMKLYKEKLLWFGDWCEHTKAWWNLRHQPNICTLFYEDMIADPTCAVTKMADFLGIPITSEMVNSIVSHTSFENMKANPKVNYSIYDRSIDDKTITFMRKGKVGDWKNHLTVAQDEELTAYIQENMRDCDIKFKYE